MSSVGWIKYVPFTIANNQTTSPYVDLGAEGPVIVGFSIHGTWTAGKISLKAFVPGSDTITGSNKVIPGFQGGTSGGGPASSTAQFDTITDTQGNTLLFGNGTATGNQYITIPDYLTFAAPQYVEVVSQATQAQAVTGYIIVRTL